MEAPVYTVCMFCKTQGDRTDLSASPCGGSFCAFHLKCVNNFIRTIPDSQGAVSFMCPECRKEVEFTVKIPSNFEILHQAQEGAQNCCLSLLKWKSLALYVLFQLAASLVFTAFHILLLVTHRLSWQLMVLKLLTYVPEWIPPPESVKTLPRAPLFMSENWIRPYSPEMSEIVDLERCSLFASVHFLALLSYLLALFHDGNAISLLWIILDGCVFLAWFWKLTANIFMHWRRLSADVTIKGLGTKQPE